MTTLGDAPGGAALIESLTKVVRDLSLLYAHSPDDSAQASLQAYIDKIDPGITAAVGADTAKTILEAFAGTVMAEKHKIEAAGAWRA